MDNLHSFFGKNPFQIKILYIQGSSHFTGTVVEHTRPSQSITAVGDVELMTIAPRTTLRDFRPFKINVPTMQVGLDKRSNRTVLYESSQHFDRKT
jgi:hypothetical protein